MKIKLPKNFAQSVNDLNKAIITQNESANGEKLAASLEALKIAETLLSELLQLGDWEEECKTLLSSESEEIIDLYFKDDHEFMTFISVQEIVFNLNGFDKSAQSHMINLLGLYR